MRESAHSKKPEPPIRVATRLGTVIDRERAASLFGAMLKYARASRMEAENNEHAADKHPTGVHPEAVGKKDGGDDE